MISKFKDYFKALLQKPYNPESFVITLVIFTFFKITVFSLGIDAPEVEWDWRFFTIVVFVVANSSILMFLFSPIIFIKRHKTQIIYGLVVAFLLTGVIAVNRVYYLFFHSYITLETIAHSSEGLSMIQAVYSTIRMGEFLWFLDIPILYFIFSRQPVEGSLRVKQLIKDKYNGKEQGRKLSKFMTVSIIVSVTILIWTPLMSIYAVSEDEHHNIQLRESGPLMYYTREAAARTALVEDRQNGVGEKQLIESYFEEVKREDLERQDKDYKGRFEGKNVILLQVEALQNVAIDNKINGQEITPNINNIIDESLFFEHTYDQTDMATADAEALVNFSLYPPGNVSAYMQYFENKFNSLPRTLKSEGYSTAALHGFEKDFYNRNEAYPNVGYEKFFSQEDYEQDEVYDGLLGDKTFLEQSIDHIKSLKEPYFAFVITLTSHHPFNYIQREDYDEIDVGKYENSIVGDYIRSIHYTDAAVGRFYEELKKNDMLEDTILVLYGDHAAFNYNERDYEELNSFFGINVRKPEEQITVHKVPFAIYDPSRELKGTVDEKMGMIDIFPTLINTLGIENPYTLGRDVLNSDEEMVIFRDGSFIQSNYYYIAREEKFYDLYSKEEVNVEDGEELVAKVERKLEISDLIYRTDYIKHIGFNSH